MEPHASTIPGRGAFLLCALAAATAVLAALAGPASGAAHVDLREELRELVRMPRWAARRDRGRAAARAADGVPRRRARYAVAPAGARV
jgi:hypothetical protein